MCGQSDCAATAIIQQRRSCGEKQSCSKTDHAWWPAQTLLFAHAHQGCSVCDMCRNHRAWFVTRAETTGLGLSYAARAVMHDGPVQASAGRNVCRWCERCQAASPPEWRYMLSLQVSDHTGQEWLTAFQVMTSCVGSVYTHIQLHAS